MQFEIYGYDLTQEAQLEKQQTLSAAAVLALQKFSKLPQNADASWRNQAVYKQKELNNFQKLNEYFNIKDKKLTLQEQQEIQAVQMRNTTHKHAFQQEEKIDGKVLFGTVKEGPVQFYSQRINKKDRKTNLVDQLLDNTDEKVKSKLKEIKEREDEERIVRYKTQQSNRKSHKK